MIEQEQLRFLLNIKFRRRKNVKNTNKNTDDFRYNYFDGFYNSSIAPNTEVNAANQSNLGIPLPSGVTPVYERTTYAYLSVSPNPIGVGQQALVNIWTTPGTDRFKAHHDYTVTITDPDGTTRSKGNGFLLGGCNLLVYIYTRQNW